MHHTTRTAYALQRNICQRPTRLYSWTRSSSSNSAALKPSKSYLEETLDTAASKTSLETCRKLLILDLNGALVVRSPGPPPRDVWSRPYMTTFRHYLCTPRTRQWLDTMVWSSAQPHNVSNMIYHTFKHQRSTLLATWTRARMGLSSKAYHKDVPTVKDLAQVWAEYRHSLYTTLLMDDSNDKAVLQPHNHLVVPEYDMTMRGHDLDVLHAGRGTGEYDDTLICVVGILDAMKDQTNVANWIRSGGLFLGESIPSHKRWWEVPEVRKCWKERGADVLEEMAIKIVPGVEPALTAKTSWTWTR